MSRPLDSSPSAPVYKVFAGAVDRAQLWQAGAPIYAIFVRRLATIASLQLFFGPGDRPHTMRQGNWIRIPDGLTSGVSYSTAGAGEADFEFVMVPSDRGSAVEFHES